MFVFLDFIFFVICIFVIGFFFVMGYVFIKDIWFFFVRVDSSFFLFYYLLGVWEFCGWI